jgi:hypothetical protein
LYGFDVPYRLGDDVGNAEAFEDGAHRTAGNDAGSRRCRAQRHATGAEVAVAVMMQRAAVTQRNAIIAFFAAAVALLIASGTSRALP